MIRTSQGQSGWWRGKVSLFVWKWFMHEYQADHLQDPTGMACRPHLFHQNPATSRRSLRFFRAVAVTTSNLLKSKLCNVAGVKTYVNSKLTCHMRAHMLAWPSIGRQNLIPLEHLSLTHFRCKELGGLRSEFWRGPLQWKLNIQHGSFINFYLLPRKSTKWFLGLPRNFKQIHNFSPSLSPSRVKNLPKSFETLALHIRSYSIVSSQ